MLGTVSSELSQIHFSYTKKMCSWMGALVAQSLSLIGGARRKSALVCELGLSPGITTELVSLLHFLLQESKTSGPGSFRLQSHLYAA